MSNKICTKCKKSKPILYFSKRNDRKSGNASLCRICVYLLGREYKKTKKGLLTDIYSQQVSHSKKRGHAKPNYTTKEFISKFIDDKLFNRVWMDWRNSNFLKELRPSFDRKRNDLPYTFDNVKVMTWEINNEKGNESQRNGELDTSIPHKKVAKYSLDGIFIEEFISVREAGRKTKILPQSISKVCNGKRTKAGGFKWKHI